MSKPQTQAGYIYLGADGKAWHIRYNAHENGVRKQRSAKLCNKDADHESKQSPSVIALAEAFMLKINEANGTNDKQRWHCCSICGYRCQRTIQGRFAKQERS